MKKYFANFPKHAFVNNSHIFYCLITLLSLTASFLFTENAHCQSYYYQLSYGIDDKTFEWGWNGYMKTIWDSGPVVINDTLSPEQTIPFPWKFYGKDVKTYKISDNGYITFDTSWVFSYPNNTAIPKPGGPNNAIYGFWRDFEIGANTSTNPLYDHVVTWTYGTAPNRIHVIEWQSISTRNNNTQLNAAYFAIRLYESGDFDIVHIWGRYNGAAMAAGTVGVENKDGTLGTMTSGSPNEKMKMDYIKPQEVPVYRFTYGSQPSYDMAGLSLTLPKILKIGNSLNIAGSLINYGMEKITSLDLNYRVDNESIQTMNITGLNISNNSTYSFTHNIPWIAKGSGSMHNISVWATNLNGNNDTKHDNDTAKGTVFVNNGVSGTKKALIEEFSTAPCGWCVDGLLITQTILDKYPNAVGFTHHAGYLTDAMTISESKTYETVFGSGAPMASIDRVSWPGERNINVSRSNNSWDNKMAAQLKEITPVNISINTTWNYEIQSLTIDAAANFVDYAYPGDLRINVFVIEDSVTGTGTDYDQTNYYSKDNPNGSVGSPSHPYYNLPYKIKGFIHRHVLRAIPSGIWGTAGVIPANPAPGQTFSQNYQYPIPDFVKKHNISIIAFVSYYDENLKDLRILNTQIEETGELKLGVEESEELQSVIISPNPVSDYINIITAKNFGKVEIYSILGNKLLESEFMNKIDVSNLLPGLYFIKINEKTYKFVKN